jgi:hypothetical protein
MGRSSNGKYTTGESNRLDLRVMLRNGQIQKSKHITGIIEWTNGSSITFESKYIKNEIYFRVVYTITSNRTGEITDYDYKIDLVTIPSNLGKGEILYLVCPESYRRARVLFMAYGHHKYLHRDWYLDNYGERLYYNSQNSSKDDYHNTMYFNYKSKVDKLEEQINGRYRKKHYKGKVTKDFQKLIQLKIRMEFHNRKRLAIVSSRLGIMMNNF